MTLYRLLSVCVCVCVCERERERERESESESERERESRRMLTFNSEFYCNPCRMYGT